MDRDGTTVFCRRDEAEVVSPLVVPHVILRAQQESVTRGGEALGSGGDASVPGRNGFYLKPALYRTTPGLNVNPQEVFHTYATICPVASADEARNEAGARDQRASVATSLDASRSLSVFPVRLSHRAVLDNENGTIRRHFQNLDDAVI